MRSMDRTYVRLWAGLLIGAVSWGCAIADQTVRVVSWNVETVGTPDSAQYASTVDVLARIDADVVAISEVASAADADALLDLAFDLGYLYTSIAPAGPFGALRNAVLSDFPITWETSWSAADLSGDALANDLTRYLLESVVDITDAGDALRVVSVHLKSGTANTDEYRRAIESFRMGQVAQHPIGSNDPIVMMGDLNADTRDAPQTPPIFTTEPSGLPEDFVTGADIRALFSGGGLINDPFNYLEPHVAVLDAEQLDGEVATRPESGRRLDYVLVNQPIADRGAATQVYDCSDEGLSGGLPLTGDPLLPEVCPSASDHLPVDSRAQKVVRQGTLARRADLFFRRLDFLAYNVLRAFPPLGKLHAPRSISVVPTPRYEHAVGHRASI